MSVSLQPVPDDSDEEAEAGSRDPVTRAEHEAAEIIARARRQAEAIVAEARGGSHLAPNPLTALGDNAEEIIGQVRKLIGKQRELQAEREEMLATIESLKSERDELVQRLTDAVERMEELARIADGVQKRSATPGSSMTPAPPPPPMRSHEPDRDEDTSLAARLRQAGKDETAAEDTSLAARLRQAEEAEAAVNHRNERDDDEDARPSGEEALPAAPYDIDDDHMTGMVNNDGRSFYDRHSAKLPRLEGDGGRSVLSAIGDMRPESEPKGRKGRRRNKK